MMMRKPFQAGSYNFRYILFLMLKFSEIFLFLCTAGAIVLINVDGSILVHKHGGAGRYISHRSASRNMQKIFGPKRFWVKKKVWPKNIWIKKNVGSKIILDPKENLVEQNSGLTKFLFQKKFRSKKIVRPKNLLAKQKFLMVKWLG